MDNQNIIPKAMFAMLPELSLNFVICEFLDSSFEECSQSAEYQFIYSALVDAINKNIIDGRIEYDDFGNYPINYLISHDTAKQWAKTYGLNWNVPNYKDPNNTIVEDTLEKDTDLVKKLEQADQRIAELKQQLAEAKAEIEKLKTTPKEYEGNLPPRTDADKLAHFIDLLLEASPELQKGGRKPTYSELHTILSYKFRNERIPVKGTIGKYMGALPD